MGAWETQERFLSRKSNIRMHDKETRCCVGSCRPLPESRFGLYVPWRSVSFPFLKIKNNSTDGADSLVRSSLFLCSALLSLLRIPKPRCARYCCCRAAAAAAAAAANCALLLSKTTTKNQQTTCHRDSVPPAETRRGGAQDRVQVPEVGVPEEVLRVLQQGRALLREVQLRRLPQHRGQRRKRSRARHSHSP